MTEYDRHIGHRQHFDPEHARGVPAASSGYEVCTSTGAGYPVFNVYRLVTRALGARLVSIAGSTKPSALSRFAMRAFGLGMAPQPAAVAARLADRRRRPTRATRPGTAEARTAGVRLAVAPAVAALLLTLVAYWLVPDTLDAGLQTDIVGYPTFADFNIYGYFWKYALCCCRVPATDARSVRRLVSIARR